MSDTPFDFLGLPPETRNRIYSHLLDASAVEIGGEIIYRRNRNPKGRHYRWREHPFPFELSIMYTSKFVHAEASAFFYGVNQFVLVSLSYGTPGGMAHYFNVHDIPFFPSSYQSAERTGRFIMGVGLGERGWRETTHAFFPLYCVPKLLNSIREKIDRNTDYGPEHEINIALHPPTHMRMNMTESTQILESWRALHSFDRAQVSSTMPLSNLYLRQFERDLIANRFDPEAWLERMQASAAEATALADAGTQARAHDMADQVIGTMNVYYALRQTSRANELRLMGEDFDQSIVKLRFNLELIVADYHHSTGRNMLPGLAAAQNAVQLIELSLNGPFPFPNQPLNRRDWWTAPERLRAYLRCGQALVGRQMMNEARDSFDNAFRAVPDDDRIYQAVWALGWTVASNDEGFPTVTMNNV